MGLAVGILVMTAGSALAFTICMGNMARELGRDPSRLGRYPRLKKAVIAALWVLTAAGTAAVLACLWAAWCCLQAGIDIFG